MSVSKITRGFSSLGKAVANAYGEDLSPREESVTFASAAGTNFSGIVTVPTPDFSANGNEIVNREWCESKIDCLDIAPAISPTFSGFVTARTPTTLVGDTQAATREYLDGYDVQWGGAILPQGSHFLGTPTLTYPEGTKPESIDGDTVATMGFAASYLSSNNAIMCEGGAIPDNVSVDTPDFSDPDLPGSTLLPKSVVMEQITGSVAISGKPVVLTGSPSVGVHDLSLDGYEIVSSWWVDAQAQAVATKTLNSVTYGAVPWRTLALGCPRVITQQVKTESGDSVAICDVRGQMIFDATLGETWYSEVSPGQSIRVTFASGNLYFGTVNSFSIQDPTQDGIEIDQQAVNCQIVFAIAVSKDAKAPSIITDFAVNEAFDIAVSTALTRSSKAIMTTSRESGFLAWSPGCATQGVSDSELLVANKAFVDEALKNTAALPNYIDGFNLYTTGTEAGLYVGPGTACLGVSAASIAHLPTPLYKSADRFSPGPNGGIVVLTKMQIYDPASYGLIKDDQLVDTSPAGWYNIYLLYDYQSGLFDVCAVLAECMSDPSFLFKEADTSAFSTSTVARYLGLAYLHPADNLGAPPHFARFTSKNGELSFLPPEDARRETQYPAIRIPGIELQPASHRSRLNDDLVASWGKKPYADKHPGFDPNAGWLEWLGYKAEVVEKFVTSVGKSLYENIFSWERDYGPADFRADPVTVWTEGFLPSLPVGTGLIEGDFTFEIPVSRLSTRKTNFTPPSVQIYPYSDYVRGNAWSRGLQTVGKDPEWKKYTPKVRPGLSYGYDHTLGVIKHSNRYMLPASDTQAITVAVDNIPFSMTYNPEEAPPDILGSMVGGSYFYDFMAYGVLTMDIKRVRVDLTQFAPMYYIVARDPDLALYGAIDDNAPPVSTPGDSTIPQILAVM